MPTRRFILHCGRCEPDLGFTVFHEGREPSIFDALDALVIQGGKTSGTLYVSEPGDVFKVCPNNQFGSGHDKLRENIRPA